MSSTKASQVNRRAARPRRPAAGEAESYRQPMQREYQSFCDRCGQALSWIGFSKAVILFACGP